MQHRKAIGIKLAAFRVEFQAIVLSQTGFEGVDRDQKRPTISFELTEERSLRNLRDATRSTHGENFTHHFSSDATELFAIVVEIFDVRLTRRKRLTRETNGEAKSNFVKRVSNNFDVQFIEIVFGNAVDEVRR